VCLIEFEKKKEEDSTPFFLLCVDDILVELESFLSWPYKEMRNTDSQKKFKKRKKKDTQEEKEKRLV
jgi:hypothetical protein